MQRHFPNNSTTRRTLYGPKMDIRHGKDNKRKTNYVAEDQLLDNSFP